MGRVHQVLFSIHGMELLYLQEFREIGIMLHKGWILFSEMQKYFFLPYQGMCELSILISLELVGGGSGFWHKHPSMIYFVCSSLDDHILCFLIFMH